MDPKKTSVIPSNDAIQKTALALINTLKSESYPGHPLHDYFSTSTPENLANTDPIWRISAMKVLATVMEHVAPAAATIVPPAVETAKTDPPPPEESTHPKKGSRVAYWVTSQVWHPAIVVEEDSLNLKGGTSHFITVAVFTPHGLLTRSVVPFTDTPKPETCTLLPLPLPLLVLAPPGPSPPTFLRSFILLIP